MGLDVEDGHLRFGVRQKRGQGCRASVVGIFVGSVAGLKKCCAIKGWSLADGDEPQSTAGGRP